MAAPGLAGGGKAAGSERPADGGSCGRAAACGAVPALCVLLCLGLGTLQVWHLYQTAELRHQLQHQQQRLAALERDVTQQLFVSAGPVRQRRSVASASQQTSPAGIPIVDRPYGYRPGLHENRPGMRVYDTFGTSTERPDSRTILPHHRSSAAFHGGQLGRVNTDPEPAPPPAAAAAEPLTQLPGTPLHHRRSRVKQDATKAKKVRRGRRRRLLRKRADAKQMEAKRMKMRGKKSREAAEARGAPTGYSTGPSSFFTDRRRTGGAGASGDHHRTDLLGAASRHRLPGDSDSLLGHQRHSGGSSRQQAPSEGRQSGSAAPSAGSGGHRRNRRLMRLVDDLRQQLGTTAAHLEGQANHYARDHQHYHGNGILRNAQRNSMFVDWQFAPWVIRHGYSRDFALRDGEITVKKPGVYYLYAQINYLDPGDINGFEMIVSGSSFAKCLTMESTDAARKVNTCHTSGITYLEIGDTVSIRDMHQLRISMLSPDRSFFGLVRLAGTGGDNGARRQRRSHDGWIY